MKFWLVTDGIERKQLCKECSHAIARTARGDEGSTKTRNPESGNGNGIKETETETETEMEYGIKYQ